MATAPRTEDELPFPELGAEFTSPFTEQGIDPFPELASEFLEPEGPAEGEAPSEPTAFGRGFRSGLRTVPALFNAAGGVGAQIIGQDQRAREFFLRAQELADEAAQFRHVGSLEEALESPGKLAAYAAETIGEQIPILASTLAMGGAGAAGQILTRLAARGVISRAAATAAKEGLKRGTLGRGFGTGAFAGTTALEGGGIALEQFEELGEVDPFVSAAFGAVGGVFELTAPVLLAGALGFGPAARAAFAESIQRSGLLSRVGKTAALGVGAEAFTEMAQEVNALTARRIVDENFDLLGEEAAYRILESGVAGGLVGGVFGGAAGAFVRRRSGPRIEDVNVDPTESPVAPGPVALLPPPPPQPGGVQGPPAPPRSIVNRPAVMTVTPGGTVIPGQVSAVETELAEAAVDEGFAPGQETSVQVTPTEPAGEVVGTTTGEASVVPAEPAQGPSVSVDEALAALPQNLQADAAEAIDSAIGEASTGNVDEALATLEGDLFLSYDEAGIDPPIPVGQLARQILADEGFVSAAAEEAEGVEAEFVPDQELDLPRPLTVTDEQLERGRRAGLYFDPEEQKDLLHSGFETAADATMRDSASPGLGIDPRAAMSFDMPGLPARTSPHLKNLDEVAGQAIAETTGLPAPTDFDSLVDTVIKTRHGLLQGTVTQEQYEELTTILENSGLAVKPAEVETPYSRRLPRTGTMTVQAIHENFENATDEKTIAALVMDEIAPRGLEDSQLEVDMEQFWAVWQNFVPRLELVITDENGMDSFVRQWGFSRTVDGAAKDGDSTTSRYAHHLTAHQELWIWRNPLIDYHMEEHAPGVYGNFGHVRVTFDEAGTPMIMEVQGDYDIKKAGFDFTIRANQASIIDGRESLLRLQSSLEFLQRSLDQLPVSQQPDGSWVVDESRLAQGETADTVRYAAENVSRTIAERHVAIEDTHRVIKEDEERIETLTKNFRFGDLDNGRGSKAQWLLQETLRALRQQGFTEALLPNNNFVAVHEGWGGKSYLQLREHIRGALGPQLRLAYRQGTLTQEQMESLAETFAEAVLFEVHREDGGVERNVRTYLRETFPGSGIEAQLETRLTELDAAITNQAKRLFRTGRVGAAVELQDLQAEREGTVSAFSAGARLILAGDTRALFSFHARAPFRSLMRRYKELYGFAKNSFDVAEEKVGRGLRDEHKMLRIQIPEAWEDPDSKVELFRDQLEYATGNSPQQDDAARIVNQDIDNSTGAHC